MRHSSSVSMQGAEFRPMQSQEHLFVITHAGSHHAGYQVYEIGAFFISLSHKRSVLLS